MNRKLAYVGPRGWAVLTLAGGAALASPFLRPAQLDSSGLNATSSPTARHAANAGAVDSSANLGESSNHLAGRVVSGVLPSTITRSNDWTSSTPPQLPAWVQQRSPLDDLIARGLPGASPDPFPQPVAPSTGPGTAPSVPQPSSPESSFLPPLSAQPISDRNAEPASELQALRPWRGGGLPKSNVPEIVASNPASIAHRDSPWPDVNDSMAEPRAVVRPEQLATAWPDQTLGIPLEQLSPQVRQPAEPASPRMVTAPLAGGLTNGSPPATVIGATLSRSTGNRSAPPTASTNSPPSAEPPAAEGRKFVYQPGIRRP